MNAGTWNPNPEQACLSSLGKKQAQKVASGITQQPDLIVSSPLIRARESAWYITNRWPDTPKVIWPIQELIYLSPAKMYPLTPEERKARIHDYWQRNDPVYRDGEDAESFANFLARVRQFHDRIRQQHGFVVVIGHGLFLKAYQLGLAHGFHTTSDWMHLFRQQERMHPIQNSELLKIAITANDL